MEIVPFIMLNDDPNKYGEPDQPCVSGIDRLSP